MMRRRDFLRTATAATLGFSPLLMAAEASAAGRFKITSVKRVGLRVEKEIGSYPDWVGNPRRINQGGGFFLQIDTDQGISGIGADVSEWLMPQISAILVGRDPFHVNSIAAELAVLTAQGRSAGAEIGVWDLIGKIAQQPLYKLWGGSRDRIAPYASMLRLSTVAERAETAARHKAAGWKAIKYRSSFETMKDDIALVTEARKAVGDDFVIMVDANKATVLYDAPSKGVPWDFTRAATTALAYQEMGVYILEEPFSRYDYEHLKALNDLIYMKLAGGESNKGINEFRDLIQGNIFDVVQPEIMISGPNHLRKIAVMAEAAFKISMAHQGDSRMGTVCDMHIMASQSERVTPFLELFDDSPIGDYGYNFSIFEKPPVLARDGYFDMPQDPGLGVKIRSDLIIKT